MADVERTATDIFETDALGSSDQILMDELLLETLNGNPEINNFHSMDSRATSQPSQASQTSHENTDNKPNLYIMTSTSLSHIHNDKDTLRPASIELASINEKGELQTYKSTSTTNKEGDTVSTIYHVKSKAVPTNDDDEDSRTNSGEADIPTSKVHHLHSGHIDKNKYHKLFCNKYFCIRILILLLSILLLILSLSYCIAQFINVELDLVVVCPERKTKEEIWRYHYEKYGINGELTVEGQYGWNSEKCMTTRPISLTIEPENLWMSNNYTVKPNDNKPNIASVLFAITAIYSVIIIVYNILTICIDIIAVRNNYLHTKCKDYNQYLLQNGMTNNTANNSKRIKPKNNVKNDGKCNCINKIKIIKRWIRFYFGDDTTGWIVRSFVGEALEIVIQTIALLLYNGYNVFDPQNEDDIYLANKPHFVTIFAVILTINCLFCGLLWMTYALISSYCHGLFFKVCLFSVDQFSDLFYTVFPFIIIYYDDYNRYNSGKTFSVILGQLNINSGLAIAASWFPLVLLCNKCLVLIIKAVKSTRFDSFVRWRLIQEIARNSDDDAVKYQVGLHGMKVSNLNQEMFDHNGNLQTNFQKDYTLQNLVNIKTASTNWAMKSIWRRFIIVIISLIYIIYGIVLISLVTEYMNDTIDYCDNIQESNFYEMNDNATYIMKQNITWSETDIDLIRDNPHLFLWDYCHYKVYPFTRNKHHQCQCRVFLISWRNGQETNNLISSSQDRHNYFNITQQQLLDHMLQKWYMLEKFQSIESENFHGRSYKFTNDMFTARKLKAFEFGAIVSLFGNDYDNSTSFSIANWQNLEYLNLENTAITSLPLAIGELNKLEIINLGGTSLAEFPSQLCKIHSLESLQMDRSKLAEIPHCIGELINLLQFTAESNPFLYGVPFALFDLVLNGNLKEMSLFSDAISYISLLHYNNISLNDSEEIINQQFSWNDKYLEADIFFSNNEICTDYDDGLLPEALDIWIEKTNACIEHCISYDGYGIHCSPIKYGDGYCDFTCSSQDCIADGGDCVQQCFDDIHNSYNRYSKCDWNKFTNNVCDQECNNTYCMNYFQTKGSTRYLEVAINEQPFDIDGHKNASSLHGAADWHQCPDWGDISETVRSDEFHESVTHCNQSYSVVNEEKIFCNPHWVANGQCDQSCQWSSLCLYDENDCNDVCVEDGDLCSLLYKEGWLLLVGSGRYHISHDEMCRFWVAILLLLDFNDPSYNCTEYMNLVDYNKDKYINFREFVPVGLTIYEHSDTIKTQYKQINCSQCVGMEYYDY